MSSGIGTGKEFVGLDGYASQFEAKLGYEPYPGTLNLELGHSVADDLEALDAIRIESWENGDRSFGPVDCYPTAVVDGESVRLHAVVPRRTDHDPSTLELVSPVELRDRFDLSDGDPFEVRVESGRPGGDPDGSPSP